jgi:hypothetical protein
MECVMTEILAHLTPHEMPGFWLAALVGFIAGMAITIAMLARKLK